MKNNEGQTKQYEPRKNHFFTIRIDDEVSKALKHQASSLGFSNVSSYARFKLLSPSILAIETKVSLIENRLIELVQLFKLMNNKSSLFDLPSEEGK